jgi:hypothetical protein
MGSWEQWVPGDTCWRLRVNPEWWLAVDAIPRSDASVGIALELRCSGNPISHPKLRLVPTAGSNLLFLVGDAVRGPIEPVGLVLDARAAARVDNEIAISGQCLEAVAGCSLVSMKGRGFRYVHAKGQSAIDITILDMPRVELALQCGVAILGDGVDVDVGLVMMLESVNSLSWRLEMRETWMRVA